MDVGKVKNWGHGYSLLQATARWRMLPFSELENMGGEAAAGAGKVGNLLGMW